MGARGREPAALRRLLDDEGYDAVAVASAREALELQDRGPIRAAIISWSLPDQPGLDLCRRLRHLDERSVLVVSSRHTEEAAAVRAFQAGVDDFVSEPLRPHELLLRLQARISARAGAAPEPRPGPSVAPPPHRIGAIEIDSLARTVTVSGEQVALGPLESALLFHLAARVGVAVSRAEILAAIYDAPADASTDRIDLLVRRLRLKLGEGADRADRIVAVPGYGFRLDRRQG